MLVFQQGVHLGLNIVYVFPSLFDQALLSLLKGSFSINQSLLMSDLLILELVLQVGNVIVESSNFELELLLSEHAISQRLLGLRQLILCGQELLLVSLSKTLVIIQRFLELLDRIILSLRSKCLETSVLVPQTLHLSHERRVQFTVRQERNAVNKN